jgi:copper homeostasis protein (lipoprotein)
VSKQDVAADLLGEVTIAAEGQQVPIDYEISYGGDEVVDDHDQAVRATIRSGGKMIYTSTTMIPVVTKDNPTSDVEIIVEPLPSQPSGS